MLSNIACRLVFPGGLNFWEEILFISCPKPSVLCLLVLVLRLCVLSCFMVHFWSHDREVWRCLQQLVSKM